ncbi:hypothetical protein Q0O77_15015, partial [Staphylococcus aureus]|nr:hypothetical protein [Staphylococcus aureus]
LKEEVISRWFQDRQQDLFAIAKFPELRQIDKILQAQNASKRNLATHQQIANYFIDITQTKPDFQEIFILDRSNKVILSSNKQHE